MWHWQLIWVQRGHHYSSEMHGHHILFTDKARLTPRPRGQIWWGGGGGEMSPCSPQIRAVETEGKVDISEYIFSLQRGFCNIL